MAGRRSRDLGQPLRHAPPRRLRSQCAARHAPDADSGGSAGVRITPTLKHTYLKVMSRQASFWSPQRVAKVRSEEHTSELQSLMRISYAVFGLKKNTLTTSHLTQNIT